MKQHSLHSPARLIITVMVMIFVAEAFVMLMFSLAGVSVTASEGLIDAAVLSLLIAPGMYFKPVQADAGATAANTAQPAMAEEYYRSLAGGPCLD